MALFSVDPGRCAKDGLCAAVCPVGVISIADGPGLPFPATGAEEACINCGHCVAVCPHAALSLEKMPSRQCRPLAQGWSLDWERAELFLKGRRSVRAYARDTVPREDLEKALDIARYAPSGLNRQPVRWIVVHDPEKTRQIAGSVISWMRSLVEAKDPMAVSLRMERMISSWEKGEDRICRGAPHLVVAYGLKEDMTAPQAATIALTYVEIAAVSLGLATCWAGYVGMALDRWPQAKALAGVPAKGTCFGAMLIGRPAVRYARIPLRDPLKVQWR